jgi:hypothetical protein
MDRLNPCRLLDKGNPGAAHRRLLLWLKKAALLACPLGAISGLTEHRQISTSVL